MLKLKDKLYVKKLREEGYLTATSEEKKNDLICGSDM